MQFICSVCGGPVLVVQRMELTTEKWIRLECEKCGSVDIREITEESEKKSSKDAQG